MIVFMIWSTAVLLAIWLMIGKRSWYEWLAYLEMRKIESLTASAWNAQECGESHIRDVMLAEALSRVEALDPAPTATETPPGIQAEWDFNGGSVPEFARKG